MKNVHALIQPAMDQVTTEPPHAEVNTQAAWAINDIFKSLQACFPAWRHAFPTEHEFQIAKRVWSKALVEAGVTHMAEIKLGMRRARATPADFFPSVGRFIQWCNPSPEDFGLLTVGRAYIAACNGNPSINLAVHHAAIATGTFDLKRSSVGDPIYKQFEYNYAVVVRRVMNGEQLNDPITKAIEESTHSHHKPTEQTQLPEPEYKAMVSVCLSQMLKGL